MLSDRRRVAVALAGFCVFLNLYAPQSVLPPRPCAQCRRLTRQLERGRSHTCYMYWYRHGRERPPERWERRDG